MGFVLPIAVAAVGVWIAFSIVVWATGRDTLLDTAPAGPPPGLRDQDPVSEATLAAVRFDTGLRGYRTGQVDAALTRLAWELGRKDEQIAVLQARLDGTYAEPEASAAAEEAEADPAIATDAAATASTTSASTTSAAPATATSTGAEADAEAAESEAEREESGEATPRGEA